MWFVYVVLCSLFLSCQDLRHRFEFYLNIDHLLDFWLAHGCSLIVADKGADIIHTRPMLQPQYDGAACQDVRGRGTFQSPKTFLASLPHLRMHHTIKVMVTQQGDFVPGYQIAQSSPKKVAEAGELHAEGHFPLGFFVTTVFRQARLKRRFA